MWLGKAVHEAPRINSALHLSHAPGYAASRRVASVAAVWGQWVRERARAFEIGCLYQYQGMVTLVAQRPGSNARASWTAARAKDGEAGCGPRGRPSKGSNKGRAGLLASPRVSRAPRKSFSS